MNMITGFDPICGPGCRVLILGSMPSVRSLELSQYYGHPRNAFWPIMCELLEGRYIEDYSRRAQLLLEHGIALWDVCHCCERETSSDARIRNEVPNDIAGLANRFGIEHVLLNGGAAASLLPPARGARPAVYAAALHEPGIYVKYEAKRDAWRERWRRSGFRSRPRMPTCSAPEFRLSNTHRHSADTNSMAACGVTKRRWACMFRLAA